MRKNEGKRMFWAFAVVCMLTTVWGASAWNGWIMAGGMAAAGGFLATAHLNGGELGPEQPWLSLSSVLLLTSGGAMLVMAEGTRFMGVIALMIGAAPVLLVFIDFLFPSRQGVSALAEIERGGP